MEAPTVIVNAAQMKELKRRKTEPVQRPSEVQNTPRQATSLGAQEATGMNIAQVKWLKDLKARPSRVQPSRKQVVDEPARVDMDNDPEPSQDQPSPSFVPFWKKHIKQMERNKNKENVKTVAPILAPPAASPPRGMKRKRFIDPQEGATRVSQIDEDMPESPAKRQQVNKGQARPPPDVEEEREEEPRQVSKGKGRLLPPVVEEREEPEQRQVNKGKAKGPPPVEEEEEEQSRPSFGNDEEDDEEEDEEVYQPDQRTENDELRKRSRRNLQSTGSASTSLSASARLSGSREQSREPSVARSSNHHERQIVRHRDFRGSRGSRAKTPINVDTSDDDVEDDGNEAQNKPPSNLERVNKLAKRNYINDLAPKRQHRRHWGQEQSDLLVKKITEVGCRWATIRDVSFRRWRGRIFNLDSSLIGVVADERAAI